MIAVDVLLNKKTLGGRRLRQVAACRNVCF